MIFSLPRVSLHLGLLRGVCREGCPPEEDGFRDGPMAVRNFAECALTGGSPGLALPHAKVVLDPLKESRRKR